MIIKQSLWHGRHFIPQAITSSLCKPPESAVAEQKEPSAVELLEEDMPYIAIENQSEQLSAARNSLFYHPTQPRQSRCTRFFAWLGIKSNEVPQENRVEGPQRIR